MAARPVLIPGPDHTIAITPEPRRVVVRSGDTIIADTRRALALKEASYKTVLYIPRKDVDMTALARSDHKTHCPYKGEAAYFSIPAGGARSVDAIWSYEHPHAAVAAIEDHLAFYPDRVDSIDVSD